MTREATETSARTIIGEPEVVEDRGADTDAALPAAATLLSGTPAVATEPTDSMVAPLPVRASIRMYRLAMSSIAAKAPGWVIVRSMICWVAMTRRIGTREASASGMGGRR